MTKTQKTIAQILNPPPVHFVGDGFRVHNFFPGRGEMPLNRMSPFFLMDYAAKHYFTPTDEPRGVGVHPHRGFETVTIAYHGKIAHHDSAGNSGIIEQGGVQWMTAGSGILHKEYHEKEWGKTGGIMQMAQIWVNLPAEYKMSIPKYQAIINEQLGKIQLPNDEGEIDIIAGNYQGIQGPASTFTPMEMYNLKMKASAKLSISLPENYNTGLLILEGSIKVNKTEATENQYVLFENTGTEIEIESLNDAIVLVLSGEPIDEPIYPYGPFLMNNKQEIIQAYQDLENGKFGYLEK
jgi:redox-sensitive bicupin YhaK (pirin superfamily)